VSAKLLRFRLNNVLEAHALFFPIANGDDALAFAIPLKVVAGYFLSKKECSFRELRAERSKNEKEGIAHTSSL
jgi:hypothetical protein